MTRVGQNTRQARDKCKIFSRSLPIISLVVSLVGSLATRADKSIGTKSAKIVGVLVADLNISRRVADGYSRCWSSSSRRYLRPLYGLVPICDITRYYGRVKETRALFNAPDENAIWKKELFFRHLTLSVFR